MQDEYDDSVLPISPRDEMDHGLDTLSEDVAPDGDEYEPCYPDGSAKHECGGKL